MKILVTLTSAVLLITAPVWACGVMDRAEPRVGHTVKSSVSGPLDHITLFFSQAVVPVSSTVEVLDEAHQNHAQLLKGSSPTTVLVAMVKNMTPGTYKVVWHTYWLDCGSVTPGDYSFTVAK